MHEEWNNLATKNEMLSLLQCKTACVYAAILNAIRVLPLDPRDNLIHDAEFVKTINPKLIATDRICCFDIYQNSAFSWLQLHHFRRC
jgi:hypothetical protein